MSPRVSLPPNALRSHRLCGKCSSATPLWVGRFIHHGSAHHQFWWEAYVVPYIARMARDLKRRSYIVRVSYVGKLYLVVVLHSLRTMINMLRCSWIVAFCYCTLLVYFTAIVPLGLRSFTSLQWGSKAQHKHAPSRLPILRTVLLPVCVFVSSVIVIFVSVKMTQRQPRCKEKRKGEEKSRKGEQKRKADKKRHNTY